MRKKSIMSILTAAALAFSLAFSPAVSAKAENSAFSYVALGDSLAYGYGAREGYVPRYYSFLTEKFNKGVELTNLGVNGWTSTDLLNALNTDENFINAVSNAKFLTLDIGGNDMLHTIYPLFTPPDPSKYDLQAAVLKSYITFSVNFPAIIERVRAINPSAHLILMNVYNPFPEAPGTIGLIHNLGNYWVPKYNEVISSIAANPVYDIEGLADVYSIFDGSQLTLTNIAYGDFHPNDSGYELMTEKLLSVTPYLKNLK